MESLAPNLLAASIFVVFVAAVVQGTMGMGFGQVAASGLIWIDPGLVPTTVVVMALCVSSASAAREYRLIDYKQLQPALIGRALGTIGSVPVITWATSQGQYSLLFGVLLLVGIVVSLARLNPGLSERTLFLAGTASGMMGTITSIGAPPMGLLYQDQTASVVRATLNTFFAIGAVFSLVALWYSGIFKVEHLSSTAILAPGFLAGVYTCRWLGEFVDQRYKKLILIFCGASAAALIGNSFGN